MQGYLGPYTSHQTNMSLTPCDYIYLVEAKFSKCDPRISRIVSITYVITHNDNYHHLCIRWRQSSFRLSE